MQKALNEAIGRPDGMRRLHTIVNIIDAYKDAGEDPDIHTNPRFRLAVRHMIGENYYNEYNSFNTKNHRVTIEDFVLPPIDKLKLNPEGSLNAGVYAFARTLGRDPTPITMLKPSQLIPGVTVGAGTLPDDLIPYVKTFVDAAFNSKEYNTMAEDGETPASCIDPGGRAPGIFYPDNGVLIKIDLSQYGFAEGSSFSATPINGGADCEIEINFPGVIKINTHINRLGKCANLQVDNVPFILDDDSNLFKGNNVKNVYIRDVVDQLYADGYVICKELGDTLQSIILKWLIDECTAGHLSYGLTQGNSICLTPDIVFATRARLVKTPCLLKKLVKGSNYRSLLLYTGELDESDAKRALNDCFKNQCILQNQAIKNNLLQGILRPKNFIIGGSEIPLSQNGINYLNAIIERIDEANRILGGLDSDIDEDDFRLECSKLKAFNLLNASINKPNTSIRTLFPPDNNTELNIEFRVGTQRGFAYALIAANKGASRGGGKKKYKGGNLNWDDIAQDYYDLFFNYMHYIGDTCSDYKFLNFLLQYPTLKLARYYYYKTIMPNMRRNYTEETSQQRELLDDETREDVTIRFKQEIGEYLQYKYPILLKSISVSLSFQSSIPHSPTTGSSSPGSWWSASPSSGSSSPGILGEDSQSPPWGPPSPNSQNQSDTEDEYLVNITQTPKETASKIYNRRVEANIEAIKTRKRQEEIQKRSYKPYRGGYKTLKKQKRTRRYTRRRNNQIK